MMATRVFTCHHCGHPMRLGVAHCGNCGSAATPMNVLLVLGLFGVGTLLLAVLGTALVAG